MPKDDKKNVNKEPVYEFTSAAYRQRRDIECWIKHIAMLYYCGYVPREVINIGTLGLEGKNGNLNRLGLKRTKQSLFTSNVHVQFFLFINNIRVLKYWQTEASKPLSKRKQPGLQTYSEMYPTEYAKLDKISKAIMDLTLFRTSFVAPDGSHRFITILNIDQPKAEKKIYEDMLRVGLNFSKKDNQFNGNHRIQLYIYLEKNNWNTMNDSRLQKLYLFFAKKFTKQEIWEQIQSMKQYKYIFEPN